MEWNDAAAVAQVLSGDKEAFSLLVQRHSRSIFHLAYRMTGNEDDANEVVQEAFLKAYRRLDRFESRSSFGTWLYRIASNCALDLLARRKPEEQHESIVESSDEEGVRPLEVAATDPSPERLVLSGELKSKVQAVLGTLTAAERTAFLLRHFENKPIDEIARTLNIRENAAKNSIFRAVQKMRKALEPAMRPAR